MTGQKTVYTANIIRLGLRKHSVQILKQLWKLVLLFNIKKRLYNVAVSSSPTPWIDILQRNTKSVSLANMFISK